MAQTMRHLRQTYISMPAVSGAAPERPAIYRSCSKTLKPGRQREGWRGGGERGGPGGGGIMMWKQAEQGVTDVAKP